MPARSPMSEQQGFVLVMALGAVLILTLIASTVALNVQTLVGVATSAKEQERVVWSSTSARSRIIYSVLTGYKTRFGFTNALSKPRLDDYGGLIQTPLADDLRVDGRWFLMQGYPFSIQDKAGLLSSNTLSAFELEQIFFQQLNRKTSAQMLSQQYQDFIDFDDQTRFMGAESYDYARQNKPGPISRSVFLPRELTKMLSWPSVYAPWDVFHADQLVWNINTAPKSILSIKTSADEKAINTLLRTRETEVISGASSAEKLLGTDSVKQEVEMVTGSVSRRFRIAVIPQQMCRSDTAETECAPLISDLIAMGDYRVKVIDLTLTPNSKSAPYRVDNVYTTSLYDYILSRELMFPLSQQIYNLLSDTFATKDASISSLNDVNAVAVKKQLINELISKKDVPIPEYKNSKIPL